MTFEEWWIKESLNKENPMTFDLALKKFAQAIWDASRDEAIESVNCENYRYYGYFCGTKGES